MADIKNDEIEQIKVGDKIYDIKDTAAHTEIGNLKEKLNGITWDGATQTLSFIL